MCVAFQSMCYVKLYRMPMLYCAFVITLRTLCIVMPTMWVLCLKHPTLWCWNTGYFADIMLLCTLFIIRLNVCDIWDLPIWSSDLRRVVKGAGNFFSFDFAFCDWTSVKMSDQFSETFWAELNQLQVECRSCFDVAEVPEIPK